MRNEERTAGNWRAGLPGIIIATAVWVAAVCPARAVETVAMYWENDGTFLKPLYRTDRHYTDGLKFVYTHQPDCNWLKGFARWNNFADNNTDVSAALGYFFGQNMYTPDEAAHPELRPKHDRVFAGWLYTGVYAQRVKENEMEHFELSLGLIGPSALADSTQRYIHNLIRTDKPDGWEDQLGNEFAIDAGWFKRQRADDLLFRHTSNFDSHLEYGFTAGLVHRNAVLSILLRAGGNLPNDFGPGRLESPACAAYSVNDKLVHWYVFSRIGGKLVQYDRFLSGLDEKPAVGVLQLGVSVQYKSFEVMYSQTFLTREYKEQPEADSYGTLNLCYRF